MGKKSKAPNLKLDLNRQKELEGRQKQFLSTLESRAAGKSPSLAEQALKASQERNMAQQLAVAKSQRGASPGLQARNLAQNMAATGAQTAQMGAMAKTQEQMAAEQALGSELTGQRAADLGMEQAQSQAKLAEFQAKEQQKQRRFGQMMSVAQGLGGAAMGMGSMGMLGGNVASSLGQTSDKNKKKEIKSESKSSGDLKDFLDKLQAYSYEYKDPNKPTTGKGRQLGIMAQDLEKSKIGKELVENTKDGKIVNYAKGYSKVLAAAADMNKRLSQLEKMVDKKQSKKD